MAVNDLKSEAKGAEENVEAANEEATDQTFTGQVLDSLTVIGSAIRSFFCEAANCFKSCTYPVKERCLRFYDDITNNFASKGTRNVPSNDNVTRFGSGSSALNE